MPAPDCRESTRRIVVIATVLAGDFCTGGMKLFRSRACALAAGGVRLFRQGCDALAQAIEVSLMAVVLIADLALAASLVATAAGLALPPPH